MINVIALLLRPYLFNARVSTKIIRLCAFGTSARYDSTDHRKVSSTKQKKGDSEGYVGKTEMDSHADTTVAGRNCVVMKYTERSCDVSPYSDEYEAVKGVPVVQAATGYTSKNGRNYILILNKALWMEHLDHSLVNPNQLRQYNCEVQDNPYAKEPMSIHSPDGEFMACL